MEESDALKRFRLYVSGGKPAEYHVGVFEVDGDEGVVLYEECVECGGWRYVLFGVYFDDESPGECALVGVDHGNGEGGGVDAGDAPKGVAPVWERPAHFI